MKFRQDKQSRPIPILLDKALRDRIEAISEKMGEPKSTVMRIAMRIGLDGLEKAFKSATAKTLASLTYPPHREGSAVVNEETNSPAKKTGKAEDILDVIEKHYPSKPAHRK